MSRWPCANAYFDMLQAQRLREVTEQTIAAQRRQLASAEARYSSGRTTKNDLLVVQVTLQTTEERLLQEDLLMARARLALNQAIGLPVNAPTSVVDVGDAPVCPPSSGCSRTPGTQSADRRGASRSNSAWRRPVTSLERSRSACRRRSAIEWTAPPSSNPQDVATGSSVSRGIWLGLAPRVGNRRGKSAAERNRIAMGRRMRALEATCALTAQSRGKGSQLTTPRARPSRQAEENLGFASSNSTVGRATVTTS